MVKQHEVDVSDGGYWAAKVKGTRAIYRTFATGDEDHILWRQLPCFSCKECRAGRPKRCKVDGAGKLESFELGKE